MAAQQVDLPGDFENWPKGTRSLPGPGDRPATWWSLTPLVLGTFVVAVEGTILIGVLPTLSRDLNTDPSTVGPTLAIYPLIYVVGAPCIAVLAGGRSQRGMCTLGLTIFAVGNLVSASAPSVLVLTAGRVIASLGACAYTPNAGARAASLGEERRGRALSVMASGFTAATLVGTPIGVFTASLVGWRTVLVAIASAAVLVALAQRVGRLTGGQVTSMTMKNRLRFLGDRRLLSILLLTFTVVAGEFVVYTYISLIIGHNVDPGASTVATSMMIFGIGTTSGTLLGGFLVDRFGWPRVLKTSMVVILCALTIIPFAHSFVFLCGCLLIWGIFGWTFTPTQVNRLFSSFPENGALLITLNGSAVQLGVATGGMVGGVILNTWGIDALSYVGAAVVLVSLALVVVLRQASPAPTDSQPASR